MFKIIESKKIFKPEIGDILYGEEYFEEFKKEDLEGVDIIPLRSMNLLSPWKALRQFHVDPSPFQAHVEYSCPLLNQHYYWAVPSYILTKDMAQYLKDTQHGKLYDYDWDWLRKMGREGSEKYPLDQDQQFEKHILFMSRATNLLLGTGFTEGTLPTDGHGRIHEAKVNLDNGDVIVVNLWFWYNK